MKSKLDVIGRREMVSFPSLGIDKLVAKVDSGADYSSIWCGSIEETDQGINCIFFAENSPYYNGQKIFFKKGQYFQKNIFNSFGDKQFRYIVNIPITIQGRAIKATFTLSDRSRKVYSVLLGRRLLQGKFVVDVSKGKQYKQKDVRERH